MPTANPSSINAVLKAATFAAQRHACQKRKGAAEEPYVNHLLEVAELVSGALSEPDDNLVIAALLHDTIEDVGVTKEELVQAFGDDVANLVVEVTDNKQLEPEERKRLQIENAPKKSVRAQAIKVADKISNLRGILSSPPTDWDFRRRQEYFVWAKAVVAGFAAPNRILKAEFDRTHEKIQDFVRLKGRGQDDDTRTLRQCYLRVDDIPLVLEKWASSGILGRSAIFISEHVTDKSEKDLIEFLKGRVGVDVAPNTTFKRDKEFTFVNFEFVV